MTLYIIGALFLWLVAGVALGILIGPRLRQLPPRVSDAELVRRAMEQDAEIDRRGMMQ